MSTKTTVKTKPKLPRISKINVWLSHYINSSNPVTYLNKTESARAAGYKAASDMGLGQIGCENYKKLSNVISQWLDEVGLSDNYLKQKLLSLIDAKETKFFAHEGIITDQVEVESLEIQRKTLDMAFKIKGSYAPEKKEVTGKNGEPIKTEYVLSPELIDMFKEIGIARDKCDIPDNKP